MINRIRHLDLDGWTRNIAVKLLAGAACVPVIGRLGDRYGNRLYSGSVWSWSPPVPSDDERARVAVGRRSGGR
jgi:hypothetical protein